MLSLGANIKETPTKTVEAIFPPDFHYPPTDTTKTCTFYEFILVDTDSVEISHTPNNNGHIMYSKIKILQVITPQEWNKPLHGKKSFSIIIIIIIIINTLSITDE